MIIPGYNAYDITEDGIVTIAATGKVLPTHIARVSNDYVYKRVQLVDANGQKKQVSIIKLLAMTYLGRPDRPSVARTKDGDNTNTVLSNVEWVACNSNSYVHSRPMSRKNKKACYDDNSVALVYDTLKELDEPRTVAALSRILDLPYSTIRYSVYALIERGRARRVQGGVEAL